MKKLMYSIAFALLAWTGQHAIAQNAGSTSALASECTTAIDRCAPAPTPKSCPAGRHWSLAGSGIAHCVDDDPVCTGDTELYHDFYGNPSCVGPVISSKSRQLGCATGYSGYRLQVQSVKTYPSGRVVTGPWYTTTDTCTKDPEPEPEPEPTPTPTPDPGGGGGGNPTPSCAASETWDGTQCVPRCSGTDIWNGSTCQQVSESCPTSTQSSTEACPLGTTGSLTFSNVVDCKGNVLNTTQTGGSCVSLPVKEEPIVCPVEVYCSEGGSYNFPTTTLHRVSWEGPTCAIRREVSQTFPGILDYCPTEEGW